MNSDQFAKTSVVVVNRLSGRGAYPSLMPARALSAWTFPPAAAT